jgi:hypothetical protein
VTFGITAPVKSVTTPEIVPIDTCADVCGENAKSITADPMKRIAASFPNATSYFLMTTSSFLVLAGIARQQTA